MKYDGIMIVIFFFLSEIKNDEHFIMPGIDKFDEFLNIFSFHPCFMTYWKSILSELTYLEQFCTWRKVWCCNNSIRPIVKDISGNAHVSALFNCGEVLNYQGTWCGIITSRRNILAIFSPLVPVVAPNYTWNWYNFNNEI